jgi:uncharacterized RDD family membrane protein YckC
VYARAVPIELDATAMPAVPAPATPSTTPAELDVTATAGGAVALAAERDRGLRAGDLLAHFRIDRRLGAGGMGEVWLATDLALDRPVAIKVLPSEVARDVSRRERLFREARAQARIHHPNVCHIYYVGEERGVVFFAMEHIPGESLAERVSKGPVPAEEAIEWVRMAALGLREAHRHGFTHRDVKPSNLMVDGHGQVKVVDFGLVTRGEAIDDGRGGAVDVTQTAMVGTPLYMAPEQGRGEVVDFRADIYALGATLHHLVAGRPPFEGGTAAEVMSQHAQRPRPALTVTTRSRRVAPLDTVLQRMMAKNAADRHPTYDALITDLERISTARTRPAGVFARTTAALVDLLVILLVGAVISMGIGLLVDIDDNLPLVAVWAAYAIVLESRWGITPGRALFEIQLVSIATGQKPTLRQAAVRWLIQCGPLVAGALLAMTGLGTAGTVVGVGGFIYSTVALLYAGVREPDKRALWDRAAGTQVRYRSGATATT